jgi:hypothetical protein
VLTKRNVFTDYDASLRQGRQHPKFLDRVVMPGLVRVDHGPGVFWNVTATRQNQGVLVLEIDRSVQVQGCPGLEV